MHARMDVGRHAYTYILYVACIVSIVCVCFYMSVYAYRYAYIAYIYSIYMHIYIVHVRMHASIDRYMNR